MGHLGYGESPDVITNVQMEEMLASDLSAFARSYAFVLGHGLDAVNAHMQSLAHLRENCVAAAISSEYFV